MSAVSCDLSVSVSLSRSWCQCICCAGDAIVYGKSVSRDMQQIRKLGDLSCFSLLFLLLLSLSLFCWLLSLAPSSSLFFKRSLQRSKVASKDQAPAKQIDDAERRSILALIDCREYQNIRQAIYIYTYIYIYIHT